MNINKVVRPVKKKSLTNKFLLNLQNFKLFGFLGVLALIAGFTFYLVTQRQNLLQQASPFLDTEYGFNTHMTTSGYHDYKNLTFEFFKQTVDDIASHGQKWVRFNIIAGEIAYLPAGSNDYVWNESNLTTYQESIDYARSKGLKIFLVTMTPDFASYFPPAKYTEITSSYHSKLAELLKDKIEIWQIFNEADTINNKGYPSPKLPALDQPFPSGYLEDLKTNIAVAKNAIKQHDQNVLITTSLTGFPLNEILINKWDDYLDVIAPELEIITFNAYPQKESEAIFAKSAIAGTASKYSKPITIGETGIPTADGRFTEADQALILEQPLFLL